MADMSPKKRWAMLAVLQEHYSEFVPFMNDGMAYLGFTSTEIQEDIAKFLQYGPHYLMVQAQRGEAKTTIAAMYCLWSLIHNPQYRVLIVSAGEKMTIQIATLIHRMILNWDRLACLRPDKHKGDRTSIEAFDVHYALKGIDKSPSVACISMGGNLPGNRADILLADDIESPKNARTPKMREILRELSGEFSSICSTGRIIYLGTPQTDQSIYNGLPQRGFEVRIWPGRYPTTEQLKVYGRHLAPLIARKMREDGSLMAGGGIAGDQGKPTDPVLQDEEFLRKKELDRGKAFFQLNYMLNTKLADEDRYPLKVDDIVVMPLGMVDKLPMEVIRGTSQDKALQFKVGDLTVRPKQPESIHTEYKEKQSRIIYIDPAGGGANGDETVYCVADFLNGNIFIRDVCGIKGGYGETELRKLNAVVRKWKPNLIIIEENMGKGAFRNAWLPFLRAKDEDGGQYEGEIEDDWVSSQKELRIIDTLEPVIGRGSLVFDQGIFENDWESTANQPMELRPTFCLTFQIAKITRDRGALAHDDRVDALASAVKHFIERLAVDQHAAIEAKERREFEEWRRDPMQRHRYGRPARQFASVNRRRR